MAKNPAIWMETRCASVASNQGPNWVRPTRCHETAFDGGFFDSITKARKHFESCGWQIMENDWWCPVCAKVRNG